MELDREDLILEIISKISILKNMDIELTKFEKVPNDLKYLLQGISSLSLDIEKKSIEIA